MVLWTDAISNAQMVDALNNLVRLNYNALAGCDTALDKVSDRGHQSLLDELKAMHDRHIWMLGEQVRVLGGAPVEEKDWRQWFDRSRVAMAAMGSDQKILAAMQANEDKLVEACKEAIQQCRASDELVAVVNDVLDEGRDPRNRLAEAARPGSRK